MNLNLDARDDGAGPFFKATGGKRKLLPELRKEFGLCALSSDIRTYREPFVGGGAVFWDLAPRRAVLNDRNPYLIKAYEGVREDVSEVCCLLRWYKHQHSEAFYYEQRKRRPRIETSTAAEVAAWFLYMNATGFNGLWRVNSAGEYNVPVGDYEDPPILKEELLRACSRRLLDTDVQLFSKDFGFILDAATEGDLVYCDPPYVPATRTASFTRYTSDGFTMDDQVRLRNGALAARRRGAEVVLSNSATPEVLSLYADGFAVREISVVRTNGARTRSRGRVGEVVIRAL